MTMNKIERIQPHNLEAEQALLSACIIDNANFEHCLDLNPSEFYDFKNQILFKHMLNMQSKKEAVDLVTLANELIEYRELEKAGGAGYLAYIADSAPIAMNCGFYADIISEMAIKRKTISFASKLYENAFMNTPVSELIDFAQSEAMTLQQSKRGDTILKMEEIIGQQVFDIEKQNSTPKERTLLLGFPRIDNLLNIEGAKLIVISARPAMGKTAFAVTCMRNLARLGVNCGFLSIEMGKEEILNRWLAMETGINTMKFYQYQGLSLDEVEQLRNAVEEMKQWAIQIDDTGSVGIEDVERKCRKMVRNGAKVLFIDQLSKIRGKTGDQFKDYTTNCNRIADLKKELETPIFLLSQLNRELEKRSDKRPTLADLKNTGALEEDADAVIFLFRPEYYEKNEQEKMRIRTHAEINIAKNRNGQTWVETNVRFIHKRTMFCHEEENYY
jgi:replicative DNA helicase